MTAAWRDAPDGPGMWVSRGAGYGDQVWQFTGMTWARCYTKGRRWYGPIVLPPDEPAQAEPDAEHLLRLRIEAEVATRVEVERLLGEALKRQGLLRTPFAPAVGAPLQKAYALLQAAREIVAILATSGSPPAVDPR